MTEPGWRLEWIEDGATWAALAPQWSRLCAAAAAPLFLEHLWLDCWWQTWAPPDRLQLRVAVIRRDGDVLAAWPLVLRHERRQGLATRLLWSMGRPVSDYWDMLLDPAVADQAGVFAAAFIAALALRAGEWDLLELDEVRADGDFMRHVAGPLAAAFVVEEAAHSACAVLPVEGEWEGWYADRVSAQRRRKIRKEWRLLAAGAAVELRCAPVADAEIARLIPELQAVEAAHPEFGPGRPGAFGEARLGEFLRRLLPLAAQRGWLRLGQLRCDGELVAYTLWFSHRRWHGGYATAYRAHAVASEQVGVGKLLLLAMLEHLWQGHGGDRIDFLRGEQEYKQGLAAMVTINRRLGAAHGGWRSRFAAWRCRRLVTCLDAWPWLRDRLAAIDRRGWRAALTRR